MFHSLCVAVSLKDHSYVSDMDFAKKYLESYGWSQGKGLGKNEDGISRPLRLRSQKDAVGLGFDRTSQFNSQVWFAKMDVAIIEARAIDRKRQDKKTEDHTSNRKRKSNDEDESLPGKSSKFYSQFVKSQSSANDQQLDKDIYSKPKRVKAKKDNIALDLDEVFKKTKGMTCHRSAHTGLTLSGKMKRLQDQEQEFKQMTKSSS